MILWFLLKNKIWDKISAVIIRAKSFKQRVKALEESKIINTKELEEKMLSGAKGRNDVLLGKRERRNTEWVDSLKQ